MLVMMVILILAVAGLLWYVMGSPRRGMADAPSQHARATAEQQLGRKPPRSFRGGQLDASYRADRGSGGFVAGSSKSHGSQRQAPHNCRQEECDSTVDQRAGQRDVDGCAKSMQHRGHRRLDHPKSPRK